MALSRDPWPPIVGRIYSSLSFWTREVDIYIFATVIFQNPRIKAFLGWDRAVNVRPLAPLGKFILFLYGLFGIF